MKSPHDRKLPRRCWCNRADCRYGRCFRKNIATLTSREALMHLAASKKPLPCYWLTRIVALLSAWKALRGYKFPPSMSVATFKQRLLGKPIGPLRVIKCNFSPNLRSDQVPLVSSIPLQSGNITGKTNFWRNVEPVLCVPIWIGNVVIVFLTKKLNRFLFFARAVLDVPS